MSAKARCDAERRPRARSRGSPTRSSSATRAPPTSSSSGSRTAATISPGASRPRSERIEGAAGPGRRPRHHVLPRRHRAARRGARGARDADRLRHHGHDGGARRRRALHGPDDPSGDGRPDGLRPAAHGSSSPCSSTAATASCRSGPTSSARTCRRAAPTTSACSCRSSTATTPCVVEGARCTVNKHLLSMHDVTADDVCGSSTRRSRSARSGTRVIKKVPALRGRTVVNFFLRELHPHADLVRAGRQAAVRRRDQLQRERDRASPRARA